MKADLAWLRLRWDTLADRAQAETALRQAFEKGLKAGLRARGGPATWSSRGGTIALRGRGTETTVVFAPDARLAAAAVAAR